MPCPNSYTTHVLLIPHHDAFRFPAQEPIRTLHRSKKSRKKPTNSSAGFAVGFAMDPCSFVRVLVGNLALKMPLVPRPAGAGAGVHPSTAPCYCKIRLNKLPCQTAAVLLVPSDGDEQAAPPAPASGALAAAFHLSKTDMERIAGKASLFSARAARLKVAVYSGRRGSTCGVNSGRLLGKVIVPLDLKGAEGRPVVLHSGWICIGKRGGKSAAQLNLTVRAEPDPRFVFEFDGEPECSPQVLQVQGNMKQPMFTCKFSCRSNSDLRTRSMPLETGSGGRNWLPPFGPDRERTSKERKGWSVTVHDLSGSPVALASMVTPFVASPGSARVSRSNPGAWLVLRPGDGTWKPWGRLECWRERGGAGAADSLGYRFELLLPDHTGMGVGVPVAESSIGGSKGGKFAIDLTASHPFGRSGSPGCSPRSSGDLSHGLWSFGNHRGFVMSAAVNGEGKCSKPTVEVGVPHVGCAEDAAAFVALAAAVDLSMDACRLFSHKLRKELSHSQSDLLR